MLQRLLKIGMLLLLLWTPISFANGQLFNVAESGATGQLNITLCLNATAQLSCQNYTVSKLHLSITATIPNHVYSNAGIRINTPGYTLNSLGIDCVSNSNKFCLFSVSNSQAKAISITEPGITHTIGGTLSGLTATGLVLKNNGGDNLTVPANATTFQFSTQVAHGGNYDVTISAQPTGLMCSLANGSGTNLNANVTNVAISCRPLTIYVGTANGPVAISHDNGASWSNTAAPLSRAWSLFFTSSGGRSGTIYGGAENGDVNYSTTNGLSWTRMTPPDGSTVWGISVTSNGTLYAATQNGNVELSTNNGATWTATASQPDGSAVESIFVTSNGALYAGTANGNVEVSTNNGVTWTPTAAQPAPGVGGSPNGDVKSIFVTSNGTLYVVTGNGEVKFSTDNGTTWSNTALTPGPALRIFVAANGHLYVGTGFGNLSYSTDNGAHWTVTPFNLNFTGGVLALFIS